MYESNRHKELQANCHQQRPCPSANCCPSCPPGKDGTNGTNGINGENGANGNNGINGTNGVDGLPGTNGTNGVDGLPGTNGTNGTNGVDGATGPAGPAGATGPAGGIADYAYIYNTTPVTIPVTAPQIVAAGAPVLFSSTGAITAGFTYNAVTGQITLVGAGTYHVIFSVSALEINQFALYLGATQVASTLYGSGSVLQQNTGSAIFTATAGQVLTLVNVSALAVTLDPLAGGLNANVNASVTLLKIA